MDGMRASPSWLLRSSKVVRMALPSLTTECPCTKRGKRRQRVVLVGMAGDQHPCRLQLPNFIPIHVQLPRKAGFISQISDEYLTQNLVASRRRDEKVQ